MPIAEDNDSAYSHWTRWMLDGAVCRCRAEYLGCGCRIAVTRGGLPQPARPTFSREVRNSEDQRRNTDATVNSRTRCSSGSVADTVNSRTYRYQPVRHAAEVRRRAEGRGGEALPCHATQRSLRSSAWSASHCALTDPIWFLPLRGTSTGAPASASWRRGTSPPRRRCTARWG